MKRYKFTDIECGKSHIWTAREALEEVNRDRSDEWEEYTLKDLEESPSEVFSWIEHFYTVEEVAP